MLIIQFTGLSGSGKTTLACKVKQLLALQKIDVEIIDGDVYRKTLCKDLGFSKEDRCENIRRLGRVANELALKADVVIIAAINPFEHIRRELNQQYNAKIVWIRCPPDELLKRDTKGLYKRALLPAGHPDKVYNFTGISDDYDQPTEHDLVISTDTEGIDSSGQKLSDFIISRLSR